MGIFPHILLTAVLKIRAFVKEEYEKRVLYCTQGNKQQQKAEDSVSTADVVGF